MFYVRLLFNLLVVHLVHSEFQLNLHHTHWISRDYQEVQHDCLRIPASMNKTYSNREIISFCLGQALPNFSEVIYHDTPHFTFVELSKKNITSQQLYAWSAPIDIIENYQLYLNQLKELNDSSLKTQVFYNCTFPRFGSICQYEITFYHENYSTLYEIIHDYYAEEFYKPNDLTCYTHLQCNRGPFPACLDWREICDGDVDCIDGNFDEEHCWELEFNICDDNEYQCINGQCIDKSFYQDGSDTSDCVDGTDGTPSPTPTDNDCYHHLPSFQCEERTYPNTFVISDWALGRSFPLLKALFSAEDKSISEECLFAFRSILPTPILEGPFFNKSCEISSCLEIIEAECPDMFYFPNTPLFLGDVYFAYLKKDSDSLAADALVIPYICYNSSLYKEFTTNSEQILFRNRTCFRPEWIENPYVPTITWESKYLSPAYGVINDLKNYYTIINDNFSICNKPNMYQCQQSLKCISINRLLNRFSDCLLGDDEDMEYLHSSGVIKFLKYHYKCMLSNVYIHLSLIKDTECDCGRLHHDECEDEDFSVVFAKRNITFQTICDGFSEMIPVLIEGENITDETECQQWPCNNIYTHCDHIWHCPKGEDEIGCYSFSTLNCSTDHHICVSPDTNQLTCLPITKANDNKIDCLGATDESYVCTGYNQLFYHKGFYCKNQVNDLCIESFDLCNNYSICENDEDERFCSQSQSATNLGICASDPSYPSEVEQFLCEEIKTIARLHIKHFSLNETSKPVQYPMANMRKKVYSRPLDTKIVSHSKYRCHRGFDVRIWRTDENRTIDYACFCPPSYYGDRCQYQNQRISLTLRFQASFDSWSTLFAIIVLLIDDSEQRLIHSFEQLTYLSARDCDTKFNIYLLYSTRPKNQSRNHAIHIDIYEKFSLKYRGSLFYPIHFPFLPVHRLVHRVFIPSYKENIYNCSKPRCINGICIKYSNGLENDTFCRCDPGWSGKYCIIPYKSICSSDSKDIGVSVYNRSICVCPINKFGYQCLLVNDICHMKNNETCQNGGQCIPSDEFMSSSNKRFTCLCPHRFSGDRCEINDNKIILSFEKNIVLSQSIFIHFFQVIDHYTPIRTTTFRTIPLIKTSIAVYWSKPFHMVFIEISKKNYYLAVVQKSYNQSTTINRTVKSSDHCKYISELFNETFVQMHALRRIKYYHIPCQRNTSSVSCFFDDDRMCFCYDLGKQRLTNCFDFDHNLTMDCLGQSNCQNDGQCFQDSPKCPQRFMCICPPCFYGTKCQFSLSGFGLSLDPIIGYYIRPNVEIVHQPKLVKITLVLTIIFMIVGFINGILSLITFNNKHICEVGCGLYLLGSSVTTLLTTMLFGLKFWILLFAQMAMITNRTFLRMQCLSLDFLLRVCLNMDQWLNICVIVERTVTVTKGPRFRKKKSKKMAKFVIIVLLIFLVGTSIYEPIYRQLMDEENDNEKRLWCISNYPPQLRIFNYTMQIFQFLTPFSINFISAIILIIKRSRIKSNFQKDTNFKTILRKQFQEHKHLFVAPVILVILGIPRLIISFVSKCMQSTNDAWLFLAGYFISFIPPMLTFAIFIWPSKVYKAQLRQTLLQYQSKMRQRLRSVQNVFYISND